jgi:hypothetical protein
MNTQLVERKKKKRNISILKQMILLQKNIVMHFK